MPEMGQPAPEQGAQGGGVADKLVALDQSVLQVTQAVTQSQLPDEVKQRAAAALEAWRGFMEALTQTAQGGGGGPQEAQGTTSPEQGGAEGAMPMSPAGMRGR